MTGQHAHARLTPDPALRASARYLLETLQPSVAGIDHVDMLILIAIIQANVSRITDDRALSARFAGLAQRPPDALRRPIPVRALAMSLNLSVETARRRTVRLQAHGLCEQVQGGVRVPAAVMAQTDHDSLLVRQFDRLRALCRDAGAPGEVAAWVDAIDPATAPMRALARLVFDHGLRISTPLLTTVGDLVGLLAWLVLLRDGSLLPGAVADARPGRQTARRVARALGLPETNVRRRVRRLVADGHASDLPDGLAATEGAALAALGHHNTVSLGRLYAALARLARDADARTEA